jgi:hypothetical protein
MKNLLRQSFIVLLITSSVITKAQIPFYSSYPSASAVVFLDFDGHTVYGSSWSTSPIQCGSSGLDNAKITEVFNRVAEDYRPFNINVTTDSNKFLAAPANKRMRVILTVSSSWYGSAGGVAFVNSFTWGDDTPCFIFSALLNYNVKNIAEAAAHEAGHTLGLYHQSSYDAQCVKLTDYNTGVGSGEIGWAPIMGVGYYRNFTLWNNGPNSFGCTSMQSDLDILTTANGFSYRNDDHSSTFANATLANFSNNQFAINGVIERNTDQDLIRFIMPATGRFQLDAVPYNVGTGNSGSDLDMQVTLLNSAQASLNVYNPGTLLNSIVDTILNAGIYYLRVEGKGNLYAPSYASLGSYSLAGRFTSESGTLPVHKLELVGSLSGDNHKLNWEIVADEEITSLTIEVSTDGRTFNRLAQTANDVRSYMYKFNGGTSAQYRLNVRFANGQQYYSNVATIRQESAVKPQLMGNIITGNTIKVSSPSIFNYALYDMNGKTIVKGRLQNGINIIDASVLVKGLYMIRFADEQQQWTDKIVRQ